MGRGKLALAKENNANVSSKKTKFEPSSVGKQQYIKYLPFNVEVDTYGILQDLRLQCLSEPRDLCKDLFHPGVEHSHSLMNIHNHRFIGAVLFYQQEIIHVTRCIG